MGGRGKGSRWTAALSPLLLEGAIQKTYKVVISEAFELDPDNSFQEKGISV